MKKHLIYLGILAAGAGCGHSYGPLGPFRNPEKWTIREGSERRPLAGHPKAVTETSYLAADSSLPRHGKYVKYVFDPTGDLITTDTYIADTLRTSRKGKFDANGYQGTTTDFDSKWTIVTSTRLLGDGRFKMVTIRPDGKSTASITGYTADGKVFIRDFFEDTAAKSKTQHSVLWYDGGRVTKIETTAKGNTMEAHYFYSQWDTPDSDLVYSSGLMGNKLLGRDHYTVNAHGDPVELVAMRGKDTTSVIRYAYMYDPNGNWVKVIRTTFANRTRVKTGYDLGDKVTVTERVIEY